MKKFLLLFLTALLCLSLVCCREEEPYVINEAPTYRVTSREQFLSDLVWVKNNPNVIEECKTTEECIAVQNIVGDRLSAMDCMNFHEVDSVLIPTIQKYSYELYSIEASGDKFIYNFKVPATLNEENQYPTVSVFVSRAKNSVIQVALSTGRNEIPFVEHETAWAYYYGGKAVVYPKNEWFTDFEQTASTILFDHYLITSNGAVLLESGINLTQEEQP
ncbi:MAG: hypothetical protein IJY42_02900 [Clostridia bacterium]|nr:hypothetical protein [Clostridia bacterium]